ncbi:MAG: right-handed parallel beta-helix repeat-containing protein [Flavobacteriales bacterium]
MKTFDRLLSLMVGTALATGVQATTYYVSASGSDTNNGTSQSTPWKTIDRVNQSTYTFQPGDQILFQRGGVYRGEIIFGNSGTATAPITIGAYGSGDAPVVSGSILVTGWTRHSGSIYKVSVPQRVEQVYVGGTRMTPARYPNTGWLRNSNGGGTQLYSTGLTQASGYWVGAKAIVRSNSSSYDTLIVSNFNNSTLTFSSSTHNMGTDPWGFFMTGKLSELDVANEWFYDANAHVLYLWAPGGVDPSTLTVEASVYWSGVNNSWQRHYQRIENITFRHQRNAGIRNDGADHVTVTGCTFTQLYHGIRSYGSYDTYSNNTFRGTYATGALLIDNNTTFENNTMTDIALIPGEGESSWGYFGVRAIGTGNVVRGNRLDNIGYTGLEVNGNSLVEKNVIKRTLATLNDGGGIAFDNADGLIIQDNVVTDLVGNFDGSANIAPHNVRMANGIYFGNTSIKNTTVQRNTVAHVPGGGINVDHTMIATGYQVKDNVLFDNDIQLIVSDYSNYNGPGATAPYYVSNFNDVYSGNVMYCLTKDQLCMKHFNCYSASPVDFGTFSGNKYFNPYNEMSILVHNIYSGGPHYFTLERWKQDKAEDTSGSTRSPLRQNAWQTTSELSGNLVVNGTFDTNVTGWGGWPTNAQVTRVTTNLDNGALKAYLPNNSVYPNFTLRNPDYLAVTSGQWYRMRFSIQSNAPGDVVVGLKGQTQLPNANVIWQRQVPFDSERRDLEIYFQSTLTDNALVQFVNQYTEPMYYLDNVQLNKVSVQAVDPTAGHVLLSNELGTAQSYSLPAGCWSDINGNITSGSVTLNAYTSAVYYKMPDTSCSVMTTGGTVGVSVFLGGPMDWSVPMMRDGLRAAGVVPAAEPYTALGYTLENSGATVSSTVAQVTGNQAMVDWVIVELRNADANYSVAARRAAIVRRDGSVVSPDGNGLIGFNVPTQGKHIAVRHRNHLSVMTAAPLATNGSTVDFTRTGTATYGQAAQLTINGRNSLWPGNVNGDDMIKYTGTSNDRDPILAAIGGTVPTNSITGYRNEDVNMDAVTLYTGTSNDRDIVLQVIGGTLPTATKADQMP